MSKPKIPNYWDYIRVEELLALQGGLEQGDAQLANEEVLFITVHQLFELSFKLVLRELRTARDLFFAPHVAEQQLSGAVRSLKRAMTILRNANPNWEVMETLTTREFLAFRDKLIPASGFQSAQLRQIEILLGLEEKERIALGVEGGYLEALRSHDGTPSPAYKRVQAQLAEQRSVRDAIDGWLWRTPIDGCGPNEKDADRKSTLLNSSHSQQSRMPSSA